MSTGVGSDSWFNPWGDCRAPPKGKDLTYPKVSQVQNQIDWGLLGIGHQWGRTGRGYTVRAKPSMLPQNKTEWG